MKIALFLLSLLILLSSVFLGSIEIGVGDIWDASTMGYEIFWELRVPRLFLAFFTGGVLALGGMVFQTLFRNPMSTPYTLGVASGATLFTAIGIIWGFATYSWLFSFVGAAGTIVVLFALTARLGGGEGASVLLVGIALSFFYSATLLGLFYMSTLQQSYEIVRFTMGSLDTVGMGDGAMVALSGLILLGVLLYRRGDFTLLLTSHSFAQLHGVNLKRLTMLLLLSVSLAVGVAVSITGPIGFVGLVIPHIIQILYAQSTHHLIGTTFYYGGIFLVLCDTLSRTLSSPSDIPIGIVTSFVGAPFFVYLIVRRR